MSLEPDLDGAHTAPKLKATAGLLCYSGDFGQLEVNICRGILGTVLTVVSNLLS